MIGGWGRARGLTLAGVLAFFPAARLAEAASAGRPGTDTQPSGRKSGSAPERALSWDQCFCSTPTGELIPPYKDLFYDRGPGCFEDRQAAGSAWFNCEDARQVLRLRCQCRQGPGAGVGLGEIVRRPGPGCGFLPVDDKGGEDASTLSCESLDAAGRAPQGRCFCRQPTDEALHPVEVLRYNWTAECLSQRPRLSGKKDELPSCDEARQALDQCFCQGPDRRVLSRSQAVYCANMRYLALLLKSGESPQISLAPCPADAGPLPEAPGPAWRKAP